MKGGEKMILVRNPETIYQARGRIENGTFQGRWHFSFDEYDDPDNRHFGTLRVLNDDTLSPGAVWPLHPHREIEVVTCCAEGEFRHADEHGQGGVLRKGWVQHTTVGTGDVPLGDQQPPRCPDAIHPDVVYSGAAGLGCLRWSRKR